MYAVVEKPVQNSLMTDPNYLPLLNDLDRVNLHVKARTRLLVRRRCYIITAYVTSWSVIFSAREINIAVLDVDGFEKCFGPAASAFEIIKLAYIHCALKENFSVTLTKEGFYMCFTDLSRTTCAFGPNYKHKVSDSATDNVHWENRNHDWSKKWLQQNSRYAVKLITKEDLLQHRAQRSSVYNGSYN